jgi:hypothetical protein
MRKVEQLLQLWERGPSCLMKNWICISSSNLVYMMSDPTISDMQKSIKTCLNPSRNKKYGNLLYN